LGNRHRRKLWRRLVCDAGLRAVVMAALADGPRSEHRSQLQSFGRRATAQPRCMAGFPRSKPRCACGDVGHGSCHIPRFAPWPGEGHL
jgi:hypothetical protein